MNFDFIYFSHELEGQDRKNYIEAWKIELCLIIIYNKCYVGTICALKPIGNYFYSTIIYHYNKV